ncbi:hypothetical protein DOTSEDRAFT_24904 [Dothistroma septosporum NZE10]|uniref:Uncharacterized protein n=1 Tax=Dothistroma septosporum (strain NZE10 / CBS 128990) TaxID=675120 RepID=M2WLK9_DOTSN|nr:hypothetical protein DOTSEDRAFT_24904 [Dothistroma septosporum NZE10]
MPYIMDSAKPKKTSTAAAVDQWIRTAPGSDYYNTLDVPRSLAIESYEDKKRKVDALYAAAAGVEGPSPSR